MLSADCDNLIEIRDLHFAYGRRRVLEGLDLDIPRGKVVAIRGAASISRDGEFILEVADAGAGIAPEERARIFDAFYTGRAPGGHVRGTGIGLSVVQEFVLAHGGSVEIVDGEFPGAHFRVRLPLVPSPAEGGRGLG